MRNQIAAANWKMNLTWKNGQELLNALLKDGHELAPHQVVVFGVPFPYLPLVQEEIQDNKNYYVGAQNCYFQRSGAFTGEVSVEMLSSVGTEYVIVGHSERREFFNETNGMIAQKINLCQDVGLKPIFCCGEPLSIREAGNQNEYVKAQLVESLFHLDASSLNNFVIAYEPIWAIGTGKTASSEQAQEMHQFIREVVAEKYGGVADTISILYGGSVKGSNAAEIFSQNDVDGGLVGGASLKADEFSAIIKSLK